jgi:hypothetical protein
MQQKRKHEVNQQITTQKNKSNENIKKKIKMKWMNSR